MMCWRFCVVFFGSQGEPLGGGVGVRCVCERYKRGQMKPTAGQCPVKGETRTKKNKQKNQCFSSFLMTQSHTYSKSEKWEKNEIIFYHVIMFGLL